MPTTESASVAVTPRAKHTGAVHDLRLQIDTHSYAVRMYRTQLDADQIIDGIFATSSFSLLTGSFACLIV